jgi:hypothetical protein
LRHTVVTFALCTKRVSSDNCKSCLQKATLRKDRKLHLISALKRKYQSRCRVLWGQIHVTPQEQMQSDNGRRISDPTAHEVPFGGGAVPLSDSNPYVRSWQRLCQLSSPYSLSAYRSIWTEGEILPPTRTQIMYVSNSFY